MPRRQTNIQAYVTAKEAASLLSEKLGRPIRADYIHRLKGVRKLVVNATTYMYLRADIEQVTIRERANNAGTSEQEQS